MINRLEGYTGDGFNQRRAYIGNENSKNLLNSKKEIEEKIKKEELNQNNFKLNQKSNTLNQMNILMRNNNFNKNH